MLLLSQIYTCICLETFPFTLLHLNLGGGFEVMYVRITYKYSSCMVTTKYKILFHEIYFNF